MDERATAMMWIPLGVFGIGLLFLIVLSAFADRNREVAKAVADDGPIFRGLPTGCLWIILVFVVACLFLYAPKLLAR